MSVLCTHVDYPEVFKRQYNVKLPKLLLQRYNGNFVHLFQEENTLFLIDIYIVVLTLLDINIYH